MYLEALREGKGKIPYCSMLILGEERVGKTSLYRQLVGKEFLIDSCPTKGIDNKTVDTVDRRALDIDKWKEKGDPEMGEEFTDALLREVVGKLPPPKEKQDGGNSIEEVREEDLINKINRIIKSIERIEEKGLQPRIELEIEEDDPPLPIASPILPVQPVVGMMSKKQSSYIRPVYMMGL